MLEIFIFFLTSQSISYSISVKTISPMRAKKICYSFMQLMLILFLRIITNLVQFNIVWLMSQMNHTTDFLQKSQ